MTLPFWFRWWKWFLWDGPSPAALIMLGVDKQSRQILYDRHDAKEPKE